ncbi:MAG: hypothetical protein ACOVNU_02810 [Candidatus Kapaibacteriota bacterium]
MGKEQNYTRYVDGLHEQIQILNDLKDLNEKIIKVKNEHIAELQTKVDELLKLLNESMSIIQHKAMTLTF